jgi:IMP dehydrogenase
MNLTYNDVTLVPQFSTIASRAECSTSVEIGGIELGIPIISSNMDTVTDYSIAKHMKKNGAIGCLHRFWSIEQNVHQYKQCSSDTMVAVGISDSEFNRALALYEAGARNFRLDVAHAANQSVVNAYNRLVERLPEARWFVGNFANYAGYEAFASKAAVAPAAILVGVGSGAACSTRVVTGHGVPMITALRSFKNARFYGMQLPAIIADGGINSSGDIAKALASGADCVMIGSMIAATEEAPGESKFEHFPMDNRTTHKRYRGSASRDSYNVQGKAASHRAPEGESMWLPCTGSIYELMEGLRAGLQSAMSYSNARTIAEFKANARVEQVSTSGYVEGLPRNKR